MTFEWGRRSDEGLTQKTVPFMFMTAEILNVQRSPDFIYYRNNCNINW